MDAINDLTRLATAGLFALNLWFIRGAFQDLKDLRERQGEHGERIARLEGAQEK